MEQIFIYLTQYALACWETLVEMAPYICLGFLVAGILHIFVHSQTIAKYLGQGRIRSVIYAALLGIPLPLCSCGVLPTTAGLKKQGANNGAAMSFLIATPETGVDSIAVTYALLDPIMTIFRPIAAFLTAITAGISENFLGKSYQEQTIHPAVDQGCKVDGCCSGEDCPPEEHRRHHSFSEKLRAAVRYGFGEILNDIAKWLLFGIAIAGAIMIAIPDDVLQTYLHGGIHSMLLMLLVGIPFYICATASTPIAAALILKGVSPGAALVFLLAGPATNAATISVVYGMFRTRATAIYLGSITVCSVVLGLLLDEIYNSLQISAAAIAGN
ncbi:permease, partial [candidate division KSB1 bacterium]